MQRTRRTSGRIGVATLLALVVTVAAERDAQALQGGEDPALLPTLLDKRYGMGGRHSLNLFFSSTLVTKFVEGAGLQLSYQYMFTDIIGLEVSGSFYLTDETNIMKEVRAQFPTSNLAPDQQHPPLSDLFQMVWNVSADLVVVPFYGKLSLASELDPAFDIYIVAGAGVAGTARDEGQAGAIVQTTSALVPAFNAGAGLRIFNLDPWMPILLFVPYFIIKPFDVLPDLGWNGLGLRIEIRDYFYPEPSDDPDIGGITNHLLIQAGLQFTFGEYD